MLTQRQVMILDILQKNNYITDAAISCLLKVSERTVLREISDINTVLGLEQIAIIDSRRSEGYYLTIFDYDQFREMMEDFENDEYAILLLLCLNQDISLEKIAEQLYLSRPSALKRLNEVREKYNDTFTIKATNKGYRLDEKVEMRCMLLSNIIEQKGIDYLYEKQFVSSGYNNWYYDMYEDMAEYLDVVNANYRTTMYLASCVLADIFFKDYSNFNECVSNLLTKVKHYITVHKQQITTELIEEAIQELSDTFKCINSDELIYALYKHLVRAITYPQLIKYNTTYIENIQISYPFSFDMTIRFIEILHSRINFSLSIDSNLLLLYFILEFEKEHTHNIKFYIYSKKQPSCEMNKRILHEYFSNCEVIITDNLHVLSRLRNCIIINSFDRSNFEGCSVLHISHLITEREIDYIRTQLNGLYSIPALLVKDNSLQLDNPIDKRDCIQAICKELIQKEIITSNEATAVLAREDMNESLCVGNVWIPHCISDRNSIGCVYIHLEHPVIVNNDEMHHVVIVMVNHEFKQSKFLFNSIYNYIITNYSRIKDATTFEEFTQYVDMSTKYR